MTDLSVTMSIRCPKCLEWSVDNAYFCHRCSQNLRPQPEEALFCRSREILAELGKIIETLAEHERERQKRKLSIEHLRKTLEKIKV